MGLENPRSSQSSPELSRRETLGEIDPEQKDPSVDRSQPQLAPAQPQADLPQTIHLQTEPAVPGPSQPEAPQPEDPALPEQAHPEHPPLELGRRIYARIKVPRRALKPSKYQSETERKIRQGRRVEKLAYVLRIEEDRCIVAYGTTFGDATKLHEDVENPDHWYPVSPAKKHGELEPLPAMESTHDDGPAWIYIGEIIPVTWKYLIRPLEERLSEESLQLVLDAIAAVTS